MKLQVATFDFTSPTSFKYRIHWCLLDVPVERRQEQLVDQAGSPSCRPSLLLLSGHLVNDLGLAPIPAPTMVPQVVI